jgi:hypothetical protein
LIIAFITIFVATAFTVYEQNMIDAAAAAAQIESNSTYTVCINSKCTTICIVNQPCHTVRSSNSTNQDNNNSNGKNNNNIIRTLPFSQGTI